MNVTQDAFLDGRLQLVQPAKGHRAGTDALLLAALARSLGGEMVADFGAGIGTAGLALASAEPTRSIVLVENDPDMAALARRNITLNGLEAQARVGEVNLTSAKAMQQARLEERMADIVMMNPPFLDPARSRASPLAQRRSSHTMQAEMLGLWLKAARRLLRKNGHVALIHRADALEQILGALQTGFGAITLRPVHPRAGENAHRLLVTAKLGARAPAIIKAPLVLHGAGSEFTQEVEMIHRQLQPL